MLQETLPSQWEQVDGLAREAVALYPDLPEVHSRLGLAFAEGAVEHFLAWRRWFDIEDHISVWRSVAHSDLLLTNAARWLEEALKHDEDSEGTLTAHLALLSAIRRDYDLMYRWMRQAIQKDALQRDWFSDPHRLPLLAQPVGPIHRVWGRLERSWINGSRADRYGPTNHHGRPCP
ncbi:MAG: hypothetical protein M1118_11335 [Chloroflexi bacterium]|nr:hypothetical protein [Chloroflexota bacterium]